MQFLQLQEPLILQKIFMIYIIITVILVIYYLALSLFAYSTAKKLFKKYKNYPRVEVPENVQSSVRMDFGKWDEKQILRGCFTRFPFHISFMFFYLFFYGIIGTLQKYLKYPKSIINFYRLNVGRLVFKFCFNLIEEFDPKQKLTTPIVSSNHVCWVDFVYMGSCLPLVSFVAKIQISKIIVIDAIARYLQTLYVDRNSADNRQKIKEGIQQRVSQFQQNPDSIFPLVIYPEGSCTNGRSIMRFNNGAFQGLSSITLFSMKYECKQFHMGLEQVSDLAHSLFTMCLRPTLRVKKYIISPLQKQTVEEYRERCREKLGEMTGFKLYDCTFKEQMDFIHKVEALAKEQRLNAEKKN